MFQDLLCAAFERRRPGSNSNMISATRKALLNLSNGDSIGARNLMLLSAKHDHLSLFRHHSIGGHPANRIDAFRYRAFCDAITG